MLGTTTVSWVSQLQKTVVLSTIETEYVGVIEASKEFIWLQHLLAELEFKQVINVLYSDSQSAIHNSSFHVRTIHYHFIRTLLEDRVLTLVKILGLKNLADMLTKTITIEKLELYAT